jgi:hypothetical protein
MEHKTSSSQSKRRNKNPKHKTERWPHKPRDETTISQAKAMGTKRHEVAQGAILQMNRMFVVVDDPHEH